MLKIYGVSLLNKLWTMRCDQNQREKVDRDVEGLS